jgi:hypothetical protein
MTANDSNDLSNALIVAQSGAESYKAFAGNAEEAARILGGGIVRNDSVLVFYDENWGICNENEAAYILKFTKINKTENLPESLLFSKISVEKITGEEIISLNVAARRSIK